jgi:hypothetical protein
MSDERGYDNKLNSLPTGEPDQQEPIYTNELCDLPFEQEIQPLRYDNKLNSIPDQEIEQQQERRRRKELNR